MLQRFSKIPFFHHSNISLLHGVNKSINAKNGRCCVIIAWLNKEHDEKIQVQ